MVHLKEPLREVVTVELREKEVIQPNVLVAAPDGERGSNCPKRYAA